MPGIYCHRLVRPRHGRLDAGFAHRVEGRCRSRVWRSLGTDGAHFLQDLSSVSGTSGTPVEFTDRYALSDEPFDKVREESEKLDTLGFGSYSDRIRDLTPRPQDLPPGATAFPVKYVRRSQSMQFNIADYAHTLMTDFFTAGGKFVRKEFHAPNDLTQLKEKVVINCPGLCSA